VGKTAKISITLLCLEAGIMLYNSILGRSMLPVKFICYVALYSNVVHTDLEEQ